MDCVTDKALVNPLQNDVSACVTISWLVLERLQGTTQKLNP